jgi:beta-mannosidase
MPRAVAVGLPEPAPHISASPRGYQSHFSHAGERIWPETNCYLDLWIETLHLSNSFRFGKPTADGIEAVVEFVGSPYMIRDALIVNPRPGQANSGIRTLAYPSDETDWTLEISSDVALRYVSIEAPGWIPSGNFFHLLAATPYSMRLQRCCDQAAPLGKVASVDSLGTATITASA